MVYNSPIAQQLFYAQVINQCGAFIRQLDLTNRVANFDTQPAFNQVVTNCPMLKSLALYGFMLFSNTKELMNIQNESTEWLSILSDNASSDVLQALDSLPSLKTLHIIESHSSGGDLCYWY
jgi:hypothetical protein